MDCTVMCNKLVLRCGEARVSKTLENEKVCKYAFLFFEAFLSQCLVCLMLCISALL